MRTLLILFVLSLFLINCDDTSSSGSGSQYRNWTPGDCRVISYDSSNNLVSDTTYLYMDMFSSDDYPVEMILAVSSNVMKIHMYEDSEYQIETMEYSLSGENVVFDDFDMNDETMEMEFYKLEYVDNKMLLHSKIKYLDPELAELVGGTYMETYVYYDSYTGPVPPSHWPDLTPEPVTDAYESDNSYTSANNIETDGTSQSHTIHTYTDVDWLKFSAESGKTYTIKSTGSTDVYAYLIDTDGSSVLDEGDDTMTDYNFEIEWTCQNTGVYYIQIEGFESGAYGVSVESRRERSKSDISGKKNTKRKAKFPFHF